MSSWVFGCGLKSREKGYGLQRPLGRRLGGGSDVMYSNLTPNRMRACLDGFQKELMHVDFTR